MIRQREIDGKIWYSALDIFNSLNQPIDIEKLKADPKVKQIDDQFYIRLDDKQDDFDNMLEALMKVPKPDKS